MRAPLLLLAFVSTLYATTGLANDAPVNVALRQHTATASPVDYARCMTIVARVQEDKRSVTVNGHVVKPGNAAKCQPQHNTVTWSVAKPQTAKKPVPAEKKADATTPAPSTPVDAAAKTN